MRCIVLIVYDAVLRRPGCVLLQVTMGGTVPDFAQRFAGTDWLTEPTPDMKLYEVTAEQLDILSTPPSVAKL
jgi:hypothetical protein